MNKNQSQILIYNANEASLGTGCWQHVEQASPFLKAPSMCLWGWYKWNLFLMRLPSPLPLLLLLEMAGTCYIITEGGKTHTPQQYLQEKTQTENIPTILSSFQAASRTSGHTSVPCAGLWSVTVTIPVPASNTGGEKHSPCSVPCGDLPNSYPSVKCHHSHY